MQHLNDSPHASDFQFVWSEEDTDVSMNTNFLLSPEDEGRMLFFPAKLQHQVYPFYGTDKKRITISGNIINEKQEERKKKSNIIFNMGQEKILEDMEKQVELLKKQIENEKKAG